MDFEKKVPEWNAEGSEPSESLKTSGFQGGYKPPAPIFNWFWHSVSACLKEIREKLSNVDNTADKDKAVKSAETAGKADKVANAMTVTFDGGTTEGTDKFTFDGSAGKNVDITPENIGAAESGHKHSASDINSGVLPVARGGTGNSSVDTTPTNGSTKMVTSGGVYAALDGKANADHTHSEYADSNHSHDASKITGLAAVATSGSYNDLKDTPEIPEGTAVDSAMSSTSTNPVQNKVVNSALSGKAPTSHRSTSTTYGMATGTYYGHAKLSDATDDTSDASSGVAATPAAVKAAYDLANGKAASSHTHAASSISAGTFTGRVQGNTTAMATLSNTQFRNIYAGTSDLTAGTSTLTTGTLYFVYE